MGDVPIGQCAFDDRLCITCDTACLTRQGQFAGSSRLRGVRVPQCLRAGTSFRPVFRFAKPLQDECSSEACVCRGSRPQIGERLDTGIFRSDGPFQQRVGIGRFRIGVRRGGRRREQERTALRIDGTGDAVQIPALALVVADFGELVVGPIVGNRESQITREPRRPVGDEGGTCVAGIDDTAADVARSHRIPRRNRCGWAGSRDAAPPRGRPWHAPRRSPG